MNYKNTIEFAKELDAKDELKKVQKEFHITITKKW